MWLLNITLLSATILIITVSTAGSVQISKPKAIILPELKNQNIAFTLANYQRSSYPAVDTDNDDDTKPLSDIEFPPVGGATILPDPQKSKIKESFERLINLQYDHGQETSYNVKRNENPRPKSADGYDFYFPSPDEVAEYKAGDKDIYLIDLQPPPKTSEPNYYAAKPKKGTKKYIPYKKHINYKMADEKRTKLSEPITRSSFPDTEVIKTSSKKRSELETTNAELQQQQTTEKQLEFNLGEYLPNPLRRNAENGERVEFQMHGFAGPNSYKFGYDTGKGKDRQFRIEQRDRDGNVEGQYGFYDQLGKMNLVKYTSKLNEGFRSENVKT